MNLPIYHKKKWFLMNISIDIGQKLLVTYKKQNLKNHILNQYPSGILLHTITVYFIDNTIPYLSNQVLLNFAFIFINSQINQSLLLLTSIETRLYRYYSYSIWTTDSLISIMTYIYIIDHHDTIDLPYRLNMIKKPTKYSNGTKSEVFTQS